MKKIFLISAAAALASISATAVSAQSNASNPKNNGLLINNIFYDGTTLLKFSQKDTSFGTARTTAMGGAFTSLGADLSTMSINPAGLGMYQRSDVGITQALSVASSTPGYFGTRPFVGGTNRTTYGLNNLGAALNLYNSSTGSLTSFTFGFTYNRAANFNSKMTLNTRNERTSIGHMYIQQLEDMKADGVDNNRLSGSEWFREDYINLNEWGAVLGYHTELAYYNSSLEEYATPIDAGALIDSYTSILTKGGIDDYDFSVGFNFGNKLYLGATLGISSINYKETVSYEEDYRENAGFDLSWMWHDQYTKITGTGVVAKFGLVYRPTPALRIGAAIHTPTFYSLDKTYDTSMRTNLVPSSSSAWVDTSDIKFNTPPRLLLGISYTIANRAVIAFDYERTWYNGIRLRDVSEWDKQDFKREAKALSNAANTFRMGAEMMVAPVVALRVGATIQPNFLKNENGIYDALVAKSYYSLSGGLGFTLGRNAYIDLTYLYKQTKYAYFDLYQYQNNTYDITVQQDGYYNNKLSRHNIVLTAGVRF